VLQVVPQVTPLQVAVPFATVGQGVHDVVPQLVRLLLRTQTPEQA
jgi:hypothetical protein